MTSKPMSSWTSTETTTFIFVNEKMHTILSPCEVFPLPNLIDE